MRIHIFFVAFLQINFVACLIDPITLTVGSGIAFAAYKLFNTKMKDPCIDDECCTNDWIPVKHHDLRYILSTRLHGQHIAANTVLGVIENIKNSDQSKALTMSFNGLPGSGKNFVAGMIADVLYKRGTNSRYYHFFNGRSYAPLESKLEDYKDRLRDTIIDSLLDCKRSLFVFDEVDMMPVGLLNVLMPFMDYTSNFHVYHGGKHEYISTNNAVFIFLSNTGSGLIVEKMLNFWQSGKDRKDLKLLDFENIIATGAFNEKGGFHKSDTISSSLIDYYVPFMPLEEHHVRLCIRDAFESRANPTKEQIDEILKSLTWGPEPYNLYAKSGCKKIKQKVITILYDRQNTKDKSHRVSGGAK